jgi:AcrR family transcriptional regulator
MSDEKKPSARERILEAAYELFSRRGIRDVSVDEIIRRSGVAIATFYRQFASKDELVTEFLDRRERVWTGESIIDAARRREKEPRAQLLAIFDLFDEWFAREDFEGDSFVNVLLEMGAAHPLGRASIAHLDHVRSLVTDIANDAGLRDSGEFAHSFQILMKGSIITATMGDSRAAPRAREMAGWLIEYHAA